MKKYIVTTTINYPTEAILKFCKKQDWKFIIVGDLVTPHDKYIELETIYSNVIYLSPQKQDLLYKELSNLLGWKTIDRRNIGFIYAYDLGADVIATVDDDNIPYDNWGENLLIGKEVFIDLYESKKNVFDPLSVTNNKHLWHRGYPIEYLNERHNIIYKGKTKRHILVQADLWDGDPDIDAILRISQKPIVKFDLIMPYTSNVISPFNSQNTFIHRKAIQYYCTLPFIGRMDDIWGSYILQHFIPNCVIYNKASVYQERNEQNLITNLKNEIIGYENTFLLVNDLMNYEKYLPEKTLKFYKLYKQHFK